MVSITINQNQNKWVAILDNCWHFSQNGVGAY